MSMRKEYLVRFGREDHSAVKTLFFTSKKQAFMVANAVSYLLWFRHDFKLGDLSEGPIRVEQDGFWMEVKEQVCGKA